MLQAQAKEREDHRKTSRTFCPFQPGFSDHNSSSAQRTVWQEVVRQQKGKTQQYDRKSPYLRYICIQSGPVPPQEGLQRLTNSTEIYKPVLPLLRVDQVISALLGGSSLQHCFKQWVVETSVSCASGNPSQGIFQLCGTIVSENGPFISVPVLTLRQSNSLTLIPGPFLLLTPKGHGILRATLLYLSSDARTLGRPDHQEDIDTSLWGQARDAEV